MGTEMRKCSKSDNDSRMHGFSEKGGGWVLRVCRIREIASVQISRMVGQASFYSISSRLLPPVRLPQMSSGITGRKKRIPTAVKMPANP